MAATSTTAAQDTRPPRRLFKKGSAIRRPARWNRNASTLSTRKDNLILSRWERAATGAAVAAAEGTDNEGPKPYDRFARFNVEVEAPIYDEELYESHLKSEDWSKQETDLLVETYRECNGKWPVVVDHYEAPEGCKDRSMEDLKARFYSISATLLQLATPITSMTAAEYARYEMLSSFNAGQETSRKKLAEGHLYRKTNEVDEETVLLGELQRIMLNQATLDGEREELRRRLDYPHATSNGYQYSTSAQLTSLWQTLFRADQMKKAPNRLRATGNPAYDGVTAMTPTSARPRDSNAGLPDSATTAGPGRRGTRDSLPSAAAAAAAATPQTTQPTDLSKADQLRYGVVLQNEKLSSGVSFASDKLSKPRVAKSAIQTEKIAAILAHIGVPELLALPTPAVVEQFEAIMAKVHVLLDLRKVAEKEEQELKVRQAEADKVKAAAAAAAGPAG